MTDQWNVALRGLAPDDVDTRQFRERIVAAATEIGWPGPHRDGCVGNVFELEWTIDKRSPKAADFIASLLGSDLGIDIRQLSISAVGDESPASPHDGLSDKYKVIVSAISAAGKHRPMSHPEWSSVTEW